jgi:hypothetical protein
MPQQKIRTTTLFLVATLAACVIYFIIDRAIETEGASLWLILVRTALSIIAGIALIILCGRVYDHLSHKPPSE